MPTYEVRNVDNDGDWHAIEAYDEELAAEDFSHQYWSHYDHPDEMLLDVRDPSGRVTHWRVRACQDIYFSANEV